MTKQRPILTDFSGGELSKKMRGRSDLPVFLKGCQTLENFMLLPQGGVTKRPGFKYMTLCAGSTAIARIEGYVRSPTESYIIEMTSARLRLHRTVGGSITTPIDSNSDAFTPGWDSTTIWEVSYASDYRGMYFCHADFAPVALLWDATDTFTWADITYQLTTGAVYTSHATNNDSGDTTLEATGAISGVSTFGILRVWHETAQYDEYTYSSYAGAIFSGLSPPLVRDYDNGDKIVVSHEYHTTSGHTGTTPFGAANHYPGAMAIYGGRYWFAASGIDKQRIWASKAYGDIVLGSSLLLDMRMEKIIKTTREEQKPSSEWAQADEPETETITYVRSIITASEGIQIDIASNMADAIVWMESAEQLHIGTVASEWTIPDDITATSPRAKLRTRMGSSKDVFPRFAWDMLVFLQSSNKQLRAYRFSEETGGYKPPDLTLYADHILGSGGAQIAFQREPRSLLFIPNDDGELSVLTYEPDAGVVGWQRWANAGDFISIAVIPEAGVDRVYAVIKHGSNYYLERLGDAFPSAQADCTFLEAWKDVSSDQGSTHTCSAWISQTVAFFVDGTYTSGDDDTADGSGTVTVPSGTKVYAGLKYTAKLQTMPLSLGSQAGTSQMHEKQIFNVRARLHRSLEFKVAYNTWTAADAEAFSFAATWEEYEDIEVPNDGSFDRDADVRILSDSPLPLTILALAPDAGMKE